MLKSQTKVSFDRFLQFRFMFTSFHKLGYFDNLSYNLRHHGSEECFGRVRNAFDVLEYLIENSAAEYLQERLQLCKPLETDNDQEVGFLIERIVDYISAYIKQHK